MIEGIYFNEAELAFHRQQLELCEQHWGKVPSHPKLEERNHIQCHGLNVADMIMRLKERLSKFLHLPSRVLEEMAVLSFRKKDFETFICQSTNESMTYCSYLAQTISKDNKQANPYAPHLISGARGYFLLLAAITSFNLAVVQHKNNQNENAVQFVVACLKWLEDIELNHLDALEHEIPTGLRKKLIQGLTQLQLSIHKARGSQIILPEDLSFMVNRKNQRSLRFALPFQGEVIYSADAYTCYLADPSALQKLYQKIQAIQDGGISVRKQILLYYNLALGHVELLDITFDAALNHFYFVNVSSTHLVSQYYFLNELIKHLNNHGTLYELAACQANVQRDGSSCCLYTYALAGIVAKLSPKQLVSATEVATPLFLDVNHQAKGQHLPALPKLRWIGIHALGDKATLISQSFSFMAETLGKVYEAKEARKLINEFKTKYDLVETDDLNAKRTYIDRLRVFFQRCLQPSSLPSIRLEHLQTKFSTKEPGKMMRRSVTYATPSEFDFLIAEFSKLGLENNPLDAQDEVKDKGFTPLMLALQRPTPSRALKLLASGMVSPDKKDAKQQSAKDYFAKLPEDSALVKNVHLQGYFKN